MQPDTEQPLKSWYDEVTKAEYENALRAVLPYFDDEPELGTPEADQFEMLLILIEAYEAKHHVITPPRAIASKEL